MIETLFKRKSVRSYTGENITEEELNIILKACDASPVGMKQYETLHLTVISNKELLKNINESTQKMFKEIADLAYKKHLFIYQENNYCKNNNCGTSTYLRSQYATTQIIRDYLDKTFITIKNYL